MKVSISHTLVIAGLLLLSPVATQAQQNYTIKTTLKIEGLPAEYAAMAEQEIVSYIKDNQRKTEITGMMGGSVVYYDGKKMTSLTDQMGQKKGYIATKEELDAEDKAKKPEAKPTYEYTNETKMIAGYSCTKAIVTTIDQDKKENKTIVWFTPDIKADRSHANKGGRGMTDLSDLKGFPLAIEASRENQGMEMKIMSAATEILTTPIDDSVFKIDAEGYSMMTYKEMKELSKAGMGK
ncbi:MAG: hypothetical protein PSX36_07045 [bacterium]|nr:hypothetical protein [bacterium]